MALSMYQASVPVFAKILTNLCAILEKAAAHAQAKKIDETVLVEARLYPDMLPLRQQVQIAADQAKGAARLAGVEPPAFEDNEKTLPDLIERVKKTIAFLDTLRSSQFDGAESREITRPFRGKPTTFMGTTFLLNLVYPNFYFHVTTAYAILRHNGVELGKADFIGGID
jgi:uncharacterized protein